MSRVTLPDSRSLHYHGWHLAPSTVTWAPSPKGSLLFGNFRRIAQDPLSFMLECMHDLGDVVRIRVGPRWGHLLSHPDHIEEVLQSRRANYVKQARGYDMLRRMLGNGLVTSDGALWARQRRLAAPAFHPHRLVRFGSCMTDAALAIAAQWEQAARATREVDVAADMMRLTLRVVSETLLGARENWDPRAISEALTDALEETARRIHSPFDIPEWIPTSGNRRFQRGMETLNRTVTTIIADRRRRPGEPSDDLLGMLMAARDEQTGEQMSDAQLRDEVMTIFLAGHETSANALSWTWYALCQHPDIARSLYREVDQVLGNREPTVADLPQLTYTRAVIQESMRLYPPVWGVVRRAVADDEIGGYFIPKGSDVVVAIYATHQHPAFWDNPRGFDPERFLGKAAERHHFAYLPFSAGPRACIGSHFALMELVLVVATLAKRFRLDLVPGIPIKMEPSITLRPRPGLRMAIRMREPSTRSDNPTQGAVR